VTRFRPNTLTLVTDRRQLAPDARTAADEMRALTALVDAAIDVGIDYIQLREADLDARSFVQVAAHAVRQSRGTGTRVLVNDRADVALVSGADGVHLKSDGPVVNVVRALGRDWMVGRSIHAGDDPATVGAPDYLIFGTVFPSASKPAGHAASGLAALSRLVGASRSPVVAIGGITPENAPLVLEAGAAGVAAVGVFLPEGRTPDARGIQRAVQQFRAIAAFRHAC